MRCGRALLARSLRCPGPLWLALLVACGPASTTPTPTDGSSPSDPTTSDPTTSTPTPTTDSASTTLPGPDRVTFTIDGDWKGTALSLTLLRNPDTVHGALDVGSVREAWPVVAPAISVDVPEPDLAALQPFPEFPEVGWVVYVAALHLEGTGDDLPGPDEVFVGVSRAWLAWLDAPAGLPVELQRLGLVEGWNGLQRYGTAWPHVVPRDELSIVVPEHEPTLVLNGAWDLAPAPPGDGRDTGGGGTTPEEPGPLRLAVVPAISMSGGPLPEALLHDAARTDPWSIRLDGAPPPDHSVVDGGDRDPLRAPTPSPVVEVPLAYTDDDEDGVFSGGDPVVNQVCDPTVGAVVTARWQDRSDDLSATFEVEGRHGWMAVLDGLHTEIRTGQVDDLAVGVGCTPVDDRDRGDGRP